MKKLFRISALLLLAGAAYLVWVFVTLPDVRTLVRTNPKTTALMEQRAAENKRKLQPLRAWSAYRVRLIS